MLLCFIDVMICDANDFVVVVVAVGPVLDRACSATLVSTAASSAC